MTKFCVLMTTRCIKLLFLLPCRLVSEKDEDGSLTPLISTPDCTYAFIKHSNLYVVATTKKNSNIAMIFVLLHKICAVS